MQAQLDAAVSHHSGNVLPSSVNAFQWEWSNFDPSQNPKPLTDYAKTLHNWFPPRDEHVTQNLYQSAMRERLAKYVKCKASLFYFYFSPDSPTEVTRGWILAHNGSKYTLWRKEVPSWGRHDGRQHFGVQIPQKPSTMAFYRHVRAATNGFETNDVIEDWRHWLRSVARSPSLAERCILFIVSWESTLFCILLWLQRNDTVSWCAMFDTEIQFLQNLYSICIS